MHIMLIYLYQIAVYGDKLQIANMLTFCYKVSYDENICIFALSI